MVGLLQDYSKYDAVGLRHLLQRIESTPKRRSTSAKIAPERRLYRRLSPETIVELAAAYEAGESTNSLCRRFDVSKGGVLKLLSDHGIAMRQQPMTQGEIDEAVRLYVADGLSIRAIAQQLGKSKGSLWKALHQREVPMRPAH
ncbi:helix-turn-helix domain-containing protein [Mycobacterium sp. C31M]